VSTSGFAKVDRPLRGRCRSNVRLRRQ
jgi:hypothetical protein